MPNDYLTETSNYYSMSVDNNYNKELVGTRSPIETAKISYQPVTVTSSSSSSTPRTESTSALSTSAVITLVMTRSPIDI